MLRTVFAIGLFALLGLFALKLVFGILPVVLGLFLGVVFWAIKIALIGVLVYLAIRIFSPNTAKRLREKFSGSSSM